MASGWRYRVQSVVGVAALTAVAVAVVNSPAAHALLQRVPVVGRLAAEAPMGTEIVFEAVVTTAVVTAAFVPLYKPRPRRVLDTIAFAHKRVVVAVFALATIGYFDYTYRLPRTTLIAITPVLLVVLPAWFAWIRRRPDGTGERAIIVGDNPTGIENIVEMYDGRMLGYIAPPTPYRSADDLSEQGPVGIADGGQAAFEHGYVGGFSRLEAVVEEYSVDSAVLVFEEASRAEFFGALQICHEHGIDAKSHVDHVDSLLVDAASKEGPIVDVTIEPWDIQDRITKRLFDLAFASTALLILSPVILLIATAIKLEGNGPILFDQERTFRFGDTFNVYKFRTLKPVDETVDLDIDGARRTPLGDFLRTTHLDEIPQLWSILVGDMSVVGPRPAITELEPDYQQELSKWNRRWFVKPGLTGLAQINDATGKEPDKKLRYDIEYIQNQSFGFDIRIVLYQIWKVVTDLLKLLR